VTDETITTKLKRKANEKMEANLKQFHKPYYLGIKPFEHQAPEGKNFSFEAFTE
jgi:hypothetical protein